MKEIYNLIMNDIDIMLYKLSKSKFRSSFHLNNKMKEYVNNKGIDVIKEHAYKFVMERLASDEIKNDGKQTPMRGHPVFIAQHACACCCRGCLEKWHHIPNGRKLTEDEVEYIVDLLMKWIMKEMKG